MPRWLRWLFGCEELTADESARLDHAIAVIPRFNAKTGASFEWYYRFEDNPIGPFDEHTGEPLGGYGPRRLVIEHNVGVSGPQTFWSSERGVYQTHAFLVKSSWHFHGTGRRLPDPQ